MADNGDKFAGFAGEVARELLGEPNKHLSTTSELRFGNKGSVSIDLEKGTWFDHGENTGGGVLALIERNRPQGPGGCRLAARERLPRRRQSVVQQP